MTRKISNAFLLCSLLIIPFMVNCKDDLIPASVAVNGSSSNIAARVSTDQTPTVYKIIPTYVAVMRGTTDTNPGVVYDNKSGSSVDVVDLTAGTIVLYNGDIPVEYLGEYTHVQIDVGAVGQTITYYDQAGVASTQFYIEFFQDYNNSDGSLTDLPSEQFFAGDILLEDTNGMSFFELDTAGNSTTAATRAGVTTPFTDPNFVSGDESTVFALASPFLIESGEAYTLNIDFDVAGGFTFMDEDEDGLFEPSTLFTSVADAANSGDNTGVTNGIEFSINAPTVSITAVAK